MKPRFQALLRPFANHLATRGVTANQVTLAALALSLATGLVIALAAGWCRSLLLVPVVLFIRMALNARWYAGPGT